MQRRGQAGPAGATGREAEMIPASTADAKTTALCFLSYRHMGNLSLSQAGKAICWRLRPSNMTAKTTATTNMAGVDIMEDDNMDSSTSPTFPITATKRVHASPPRAGHKTFTTTQRRYGLPSCYKPHFRLGDWEMTCRKADCDVNIYNYAKVEPFDQNTDLTEVLGVLRPIDGGDIVEASWIAPHCLPGHVTGKWLRLKVIPTPHPGCLPKWHISYSGWSAYHTALASPPDLSALPLEEAAGTLARTLEAAGKTAFRLTTHRSTRCAGKPWWTDECAQTVRDRHRAGNKWRKTPTLQAGTNYRRLDAICARVILQAKRKAWDSHCSSLSTRRTWDFIHAMEEAKTRSPIPIQDPSRQPLSDPQKAEIPADHYCQKIGHPSALHPPSKLTSVITTAITSSGTQELTQPFTSHEMASALGSLKTGKSPGPDHIPYEFLTHSSSSFQATLLQLCNTSWSHGSFATCWKPSILIPIPKPGKDSTLPASYRPIALLSCMEKLMERLVATRLSWWLEEHHLLREEQCDFWPHRSSLDVLGQIEYHICDTYHHRQVMLVLFVDLEGAFDSAPHKGILYKLARMDDITIVSMAPSLAEAQ
ncbi:putative RNA-directed DNA polymerase from transposon X-element [Portunus trituberculatus]|uniref:Putative RNA-directed DNA polymerase from transposon X-element n=1 Tax=Portunus trituberculatus TaxID=210409 RepID=A0A5B7CXS1_PORTR|nr:putative RNA-directed DNA polymerase from transposon X-element [Portunus trituberculatus]